MPQYFGSTYEFERVRYNQGIFKATAGADDITDMFADFGYSLDSTDVEIDKFLFPKEIYMMLLISPVPLYPFATNISVPTKKLIRSMSCDITSLKYFS